MNNICSDKNRICRQNTNCKICSDGYCLQQNGDSQDCLQISTLKNFIGIQNGNCQYTQSKNIVCYQYLDGVCQYRLNQDSICTLIVADSNILGKTVDGDCYFSGQVPNQIKFCVSNYCIYKNQKGYSCQNINQNSYSIIGSDLQQICLTSPIDNNYYRCRYNYCLVKNSNGNNCVLLDPNIEERVAKNYNDDSCQSLDQQSQNSKNCAPNYCLDSDNNCVLLSSAQGYLGKQLILDHCLDQGTSQYPLIQCFDGFCILNNSCQAIKNEILAKDINQNCQIAIPCTQKLKLIDCQFSLDICYYNYYCYYLNYQNSNGCTSGDQLQRYGADDDGKCLLVGQTKAIKCAQGYCIYNDSCRIYDNIYIGRDLKYQCLTEKQTAAVQCKYMQKFQTFLIFLICVFLSTEIAPTIDQIHITQKSQCLKCKQKYALHFTGECNKCPDNCDNCIYGGFYNQQSINWSEVQDQYSQYLLQKLTPDEYSIRCTSCKFGYTQKPTYKECTQCHISCQNCYTGMPNYNHSNSLNFDPKFTYSTSLIYKCLACANPNYIFSDDDKCSQQVIQNCLTELYIVQNQNPYILTQYSWKLSQNAIAFCFKCSYQYINIQNTYCSTILFFIGTFIKSIANCQNIVLYNVDYNSQQFQTYCYSCFTNTCMYENALTYDDSIQQVQQCQKNIQNCLQCYSYISEDNYIYQCIKCEKDYVVTLQGCQKCPDGCNGCFLSNSYIQFSQMLNFNQNHTACHICPYSCQVCEKIGDTSTNPYNIYGALCKKCKDNLPIPQIIPLNEQSQYKWLYDSYRQKCILCMKSDQGCTYQTIKKQIYGFCGSSQDNIGDGSQNQPLNIQRSSEINWDQVIIDKTDLTKYLIFYNEMGVEFIDVELIINQSECIIYQSIQINTNILNYIFGLQRFQLTIKNQATSKSTIYTNTFLEEQQEILPLPIYIIEVYSYMDSFSQYYQTQIDEEMIHVEANYISLNSVNFSHISSSLGQSQLIKLKAKSIDIQYITVDNLTCIQCVNGNLNLEISGEASISNSIFQNNLSQNGAGIFLQSSNYIQMLSQQYRLLETKQNPIKKAQLFKNQFKNNTSLNNGGAIYYLNIESQILNTTISNNKANNLGGGIFNLIQLNMINDKILQDYYQLYNILIQNTYILYNQAQSGGGYYSSFNVPSLKNSFILGNKASQQGSDMTGFPTQYLVYYNNKLLQQNDTISVPSGKIGVIYIFFLLYLQIILKFLKQGQFTVFLTSNNRQQIYKAIENDNIKLEVKTINDPFVRNNLMLRNGNLTFQDNMFDLSILEVYGKFKQAQQVILQCDRIKQVQYAQGDIDKILTDIKFEFKLKIIDECQAGYRSSLINNTYDSCQECLEKTYNIKSGQSTCQKCQSSSFQCSNSNIGLPDGFFRLNNNTDIIKQCRITIQIASIAITVIIVFNIWNTLYQAYKQCQKYKTEGIFEYLLNTNQM
ncbi:hypothetical protein ABPG74_004850 [Tetrahymena malaccensis]